MPYLLLDSNLGEWTHTCNHRLMHCLRIKTTWSATELSDGERPVAKNLSSLDQAKPEAGLMFGFFQSQKPISSLLSIPVRLFFCQWQVNVSAMRGGKLSVLFTTTCPVLSTECLTDNRSLILIINKWFNCLTQGACSLVPLPREFNNPKLWQLPVLLHLLHLLHEDSIYCIYCGDWDSIPQEVYGRRPQLHEEQTLAPAKNKAWQLKQLSPRPRDGWMSPKGTAISSSSRRHPGLERNWLSWALRAPGQFLNLWSL